MYKPKFKFELEFSEEEMAEFLSNNGYMVHGRNESGELMATDMDSYRSARKERPVTVHFENLFKSLLLALRKK